MRLTTNNHRKPFWARLSLKGWLKLRRKEEQFVADGMTDEYSCHEHSSESYSDEQEENELWWENRYDVNNGGLSTEDSSLDDETCKRRHSCSGTECIYRRSISSAGRLPQHQLPRHSASAAALVPEDSNFLKVDQFIDKKQFRIFAGTWNVGGRSPNDNMDVEEWLGSLKEPADIYVIGFQEVVALNAGNVLGGVESTVPAARWLHLIRRTLNSIKNYSSSCSGCFHYGTNSSAAESSNDIHQLDMSSIPFEMRRSCSTPSYLWRQRPDTFEPVIVVNHDSINRKENNIIRITNMDEYSRCSDARGDYKSACSSKYALVASKQMVGILLCVWVRADLRRSVHNVKVSRVGCGLMGYLGNKGSISISMCLHQTSFCFVCAHLASGQKCGDEMRRNADVAEILKRTQFARVRQSVNGQHLDQLPETILEHDRIIWLGDLNYRLALSSSVTRALLAREDWDALLENDQLHIQRKAGRVFKGPWHEGKIYFAPTYKYRTNSDTYTLEKVKLGEKRRTPAWCDRILWYGSGLRQLAYVRAETKLSDHRPVYAVFSAEVDVLSRQKLKDFLVCKADKVGPEDTIFINEKTENITKHDNYTYLQHEK